MSGFQKLQEHWKVGSVWQVIAILLAFTCTGFTIVWLMRPILFFFFGEVIPTWARVSYYLLILPIYNLALLFYGFIFGQLKFFLEFERRSFRRIASLFRKN